MQQPNIPGATTTAAQSDRIMLLLIGKPFTGKTWAAATFPNPVFLDFDHKAKPGTLSVPFWSRAFCDKYAPTGNPNLPPNKRDALLNYLIAHIGRDFPASSTLVLDSGTAIEAAFHHQTEKVEPVPLGKGGKPDGFYVWGQKLKYFGTLMELLKIHTGHVVYIMHEQDEKSESGLPTGRIKPLMSGSFVDQIASHFTAMFRQTVEIFEGKPYYVWATKPDKAFECNNTFQMEKPRCEASFNSIAQYFNPSTPTPTQQTTAVSQ